MVKRKAAVVCRKKQQEQQCLKCAGLALLIYIKLTTKQALVYTEFGVQCGHGAQIASIGFTICTVRVALRFVTSGRGLSHFVIGHYQMDNGNNEPSNCRWATNIEQQRNKRRTGEYTKIVQRTANGEVIGEWRSLAEASEATGIHKNTLQSRCSKHYKALDGSIWEYQK